MFLNCQPIPIAVRTNVISLGGKPPAKRSNIPTPGRSRRAPVIAVVAPPNADACAMQQCPALRTDIVVAFAQLRREFIGLVGSALARPIAARARQAEKVFRQGLILTTTPGSEMVGPDPIYPPTRAFVHALRDLGYIEGRNLVLERRSAEGRLERLGDIVAELVRLKVDVTGGNPPARAAKAVTTTVPIVALGVPDPVGDGLVQSLARPGGNVTGLTIHVGSESEVKRRQLLKEMLPGVSRVAYLGGKKNKDWAGIWGKSARQRAQALGVKLALARTGRDLASHISRRRQRSPTRRARSSAMRPVACPPAAWRAMS